MAKILVILSMSPYSTGSAKESLEFAMSATGYGHDVSIVFIDDGVYQLVEPSSQASLYTIKQPAKIAKSLPFFDIENTFVCQQSIQKRNIELSQLTKQYEVIDAAEIRALINAHAFVVNL